MPILLNKSLFVLTSAVCVACLSSHALAQSSPNEPHSTETPLGWSGSVGFGVVNMPNYSGSKDRSSVPVLNFGLNYKTQDWGSFGIGQRGLASWTFLETKQYEAGVYLGFDSGRRDKKAKPGAFGGGGADRLNGLGEIKSATELGLFGTGVIGVVPLTLNWHGIISGDKNAVTGEKRKGSQLEISSTIPYAINEQLSISATPRLVWADRNYMQTYYGVTAAQAAKSRFNVFNAKAGLHKAELELGLNYKINKSWSANTFVNFTRLNGSAKDSPITEKNNQTTTGVGISYNF